MSWRMSQLMVSFERRIILQFYGFMDGAMNSSRSTLVGAPAAVVGYGGADTVVRFGAALGVEAGRRR